MNKIAKIETLAVEQAPVAIWALGRQRVGKTCFLTALLDTVRAKGGNPEIWDADIHNQSSSLSTYFSDAQGPSHRSLGEQRRWLEDRIQSQLDSRRDVVLDVGGGATALQEIVDDGPIAELLDSQGIRLTVLYMIGPDPADLDYLQDMQRRGLALPQQSLIVLNGGLVTRGLDIGMTFRPILSQPILVEALRDGAKILTMPSLSNMADVAKQGLSFTRYLDPGETGKSPPITAWNRLMVRKWIGQTFPESLRSVPAGWLPRLGAAESY